MTYHSGKFVDLDPMCQNSEFFDLEVQIGHSIRGKMEVAVIQDLWPRIPELFRAPRFSSYIKSALYSLSWMKEVDENSKIVKQLKERTIDFWGKKEGKLSIKFTMDRYVRDRTKHNFTYGEISGTIGPSHSLESRQFHRFTRVLKGLGCNPRQGGNIRYEENFCTAFFHVNYEKSSVLVDFSNSFRKRPNGDLHDGILKNLHVIVPTDVINDTNFSKCPNDFTDLGSVLYKNKMFLYNMNSIQEFPPNGLEMTIYHQKAVERLRSIPLLVAQLEGKNCMNIVLRENSDGVIVHSLTHNVLRMDPNDTHSFEIYASQFGMPIDGLKISSFLPLNWMKRPRPMLDFFCDSDNPAINDPEDGVTLPEPTRTDQDGLILLNIKANNPGIKLGKYRKECTIDSQIYTVLLNYTSKNNTSQWCDLMINLNIFYDFPEVKEPTWYGNVREVFTRYAYLYPVMRPFIHLEDITNVLQRLRPLKMAMTLPLEHHNFMPISRDLSKKTTNMILRWLENPTIGNPPKVSLDDIKRSIQTAIRFELSTIPLYMTALLSIRPGYNKAAKKTLKHIMIQEMAHTTLAANILNGIGGKPIFNEASAVPVFPSPLPNNPDIVMVLGPLSKSRIEHTFMEIEKPAATVETRCLKYLLKESIHADVLTYKCPITTNPNTISQLYNNILHGIIQLEKEAELENTTIFTGLKSRQVKDDDWYSDVDGKPFAVTNLRTAKRAVAQIVEEGEGSDVCNPLTTSKHLSHYYLFSQMAKERDLIIHSNETCISEGKNRDLYMMETEYCHNGTNLQTCNITYSYNGPNRPLAADGIWPMIEDPQIWKYKINSKAHRYSLQFDSMYTKLLKCFHELFNGHTNKMRFCMSMMYSLLVQGEKLVRTPIEEGIDPMIGPNAGPTFTFIDEY
ncbi:unnamed protein product [Dimorphilus gyrociliatus]|uniref:Iminophenyl-pyruvate dimer synthase domain-containing protein n=1 Tax=Dimorphilus gyrociliatus TaxID=2664684 RepID=A0A7I8VCL7_9ANNE|nr:unnamed protein product [Dimorphilus gyrociliatus]